MLGRPTAPQERARRFAPLVFDDLELGCTVRIDARFYQRRKRGQKWTIYKIEINLSYRELTAPLTTGFRDVVRYDCKHYPIEKHEFWKSNRPQDLSELFRGRSLAEIFEQAY